MQGIQWIQLEKEEEAKARAVEYKTRQGGKKIQRKENDDDDDEVQNIDEESKLNLARKFENLRGNLLCKTLMPFCIFLIF